ncbi:MAG TPA: chemotaxis protein CheB [Polyangiaceae bacterium]|jgi:two-component system chemotaxis response regulator CheB
MNTAAAPIEAIVVGGSSGALEALLVILPALPQAFLVPVAVVVHVPPNRPSALAAVLANQCAIRVKEAEDKEPLVAGTVYIAPPDYHLLIEQDRTVGFSVDAPVQFSRPSIDVLFESAAEAYGAALVGLLLTGGNEDGAAGLARIQQLGGTAVIQSLETARISTMPAAGLRTTKAPHVLPLPEIGPFLVTLSRRALGAEPS